MTKIILDTNILLSKHKIDIFSEISRICDFNYELCVLDKTLEELKNKKGSKLALNLITAKRVGIIKTKMDKSVDDLILELVEMEKSAIVVTQDIDLKRLLKEKGIKTITIRQNKYLKFVN